MEQDLYQTLLRCNRVLKDTDELYRQLAYRFGLSDCAFWILYLLRENEQTYTQRDICKLLSLPKQTVHSAMKTLEQYVTLETVEQNRKSKQLRLTAAGEELVHHTIDHVITAELQTLAQFSPAERLQFVQFLEKYANELHKQTETLAEPRKTGDQPSKA